LGLKAILLFGLPKKKEHVGSQAYAPVGIVQQAVVVVKAKVKGIAVITDVCLCEYTSHGHCGIVESQKSKVKSQKLRRTKHENVEINNDATLPLLAQTALSHVQAGADMVAPSSMMKRQVGEIRKILNQNGYQETPIMGYSAKFASAFYGPFREAADSAPRFGNRRGYQLDPADAKGALREVADDIKEGADIVMVKPGLPYLDILCQVKQKFNMPTAAYCVSGEYAMLEAAIQKGWLSEDAIRETLLSLHRAGADLIITYWAMKMTKNKKVLHKYLCSLSAS
ncbi:MAG: porphobilinogen synthase, partial [Candidatus Omnitrophica bacterium]|nr:porphobilinogen synthase [Candidatus Omnitrophota bacterium]